MSWEVHYRVLKGGGWEYRIGWTSAPTRERAVSNVRHRSVGKLAQQFRLVKCEVVS